VAIIGETRGQPGSFFSVSSICPVGKKVFMSMSPAWARRTTASWSDWKE
jgi:hypothetical protein